MDNIEERIERIERELFGFTFEEASEYLHKVSENQKRMDAIEFDNFCSTNLKTMQRAEKCVGA